MIQHPSRRSRYRAMTMAEIIFSILLVGGVMVVALNMVSTSVMARQMISDRSHGSLLAHDLMSEIMQQSYREASELVTFGKELGETDGTRTFFDDIDDYHGWVASPPQSKDGTKLTELIGWQRGVKVDYILPDDLKTITTENTGVKKITVIIQRDGEVIATLIGIKTSSYAMHKALRQEQ